MLLNDFVKNVLSIIKSRYEGKADVKTNEVLKNNGVKLTGVTIKEEGVNISPTIYIDEFYEDYESGRKSPEDIASEIINIYNSAKSSKSIDIDFFNSYEKVRKMLFAKLINFESNKLLLQDVPYEKFLDLAIVPYCLLNTKEIGNEPLRASILIHNPHIEQWKIDRETVIRDAMANTRRKSGSLIIGMNKLMDSLMDGLMDGLMEENEEGSGQDMSQLEEEDSMFVMTNKMKLNGAISMTDLDALGRFSKSIKKDLFIIPSSIHEVLLLPTESPKDLESLNEMVISVNKNELLQEEILSDHVYYFAKEGGYISLKQ
ncbi:MAG: DUF5688 family protein [Lachnospiraceae bacterium]|nr:DUF5688 family protein [Lachnospiraceae bacterium]